MARMTFKVPTPASLGMAVTRMTIHPILPIFSRAWQAKNHVYLLPWIRRETLARADLPLCIGRGPLGKHRRMNILGFFGRADWVPLWEILMGQACEVCGKGPQVGNQVTTRGRAKYLGGVGTKVTGISRRQFKPNLRTVRVTAENGAHKTMRVCAQCLRSGAVTRLIRVAPFRLPGSEKAKREKAATAGAAEKPRAPAEYVAPEGVKIRKRKRSKKEEPRELNWLRGLLIRLPVAVFRLFAIAIHFAAMALSREEVQKVSLLGRLLLSDEELDRMTSQLGAILDYMELLGEVNTDGVEPMAHADRRGQRVPRRPRHPEPGPRPGAGQCPASRRRVLPGSGRLGTAES